MTPADIRSAKRAAFSNAFDLAWDKPLPDPLPDMDEAREDLEFVKRMYATQERLWLLGETTPGSVEDWEAALFYAEKVFEVVSEKARDLWNFRKREADQKLKRRRQTQTARNQALKKWRRLDPEGYARRYRTGRR